MVSKVQQVAAIEAQIQDLQKQREEIINSPGYQSEAEFNGKLNELLGSYGKGLK
ncbi:transcriptional regulator, partial [Pseudomonas aeruginosa]|nr:transcriptional regulator [Pseudomonas aeruginosa]EKW7960213.1 transcriptional regulator [Pseudomonas aeruginosa]